MSELNANEKLFDDDHDDWIAREIQKLQEDEARRKAMIHTFIAGRRYSISEASKSFAKSVTLEADNINPMTGYNCIFIYLRKDGRHHIFREEHGGWTRTYTDVQLMGKKIKEVD